MTESSLAELQDREAPRREEAPGRLPMLGRAVAVFSLASSCLVLTVPLYAGRRILTGREAARRWFWRRFVELLQRLGPAYVKCGQILSTRRDELPDDLCDTLALLQDRVEPLPAGVAEAELTACFGAPLSATFAEFDPVPVASGSVASVYRARTVDRKQVAVKVRRPGIERVMAADLALARRVGRTLARIPAFRSTPVVAVVENMCTAIEQQLDFLREAHCLERIGGAVASVPRVWVPRPLSALCRRNILVMEFIPGLSRDTHAALRPAMRKKLAETTLSSAYTMLFVEGFVHCDMHPGNLYFLAAGQVVILDAGFSVQMSPRMRALFAEFFLEMSWGRSWRCAEIVLECAIGRSPDATVEQFLPEMADLARRNHKLPACQFSLIAFASEMFDLHRRHGLRAAPELVFPLLTLLVIEGIVRALDPEINFQETAKPILARAIFSVPGAQAASGSRV